MGSQDTWDLNEAKESLLLMTDSERGIMEGDDLDEKDYKRIAARVKLCKISDPECTACE